MTVYEINESLNAAFQRRDAMLGEPAPTGKRHFRIAPLFSSTQLGGPRNGFDPRSKSRRGPRAWICWGTRMPRMPAETAANACNVWNKRTEHGTAKRGEWNRRWRLPGTIRGISAALSA